MVAGEVDVLVGLQARRLHATSWEEIGDLRVSKSQFGCGWSLTGTHPDLKTSGQVIRSAASEGLVHAVSSLPRGRAVYFMEFMAQTVRKEFMTFQKKFITLIVN